MCVCLPEGEVSDISHARAAKDESSIIDVLTAVEDNDDDDKNEGDAAHANATTTTTTTESVERSEKSDTEKETIIEKDADVAKEGKSAVDALEASTSASASAGAGVEGTIFALPMPSMMRQLTGSNDEETGASV